MSYPGSQETTATSTAPGFAAVETQAAERLTSATPPAPEPPPPPSPPPADPASAQQAGPNVTQPPAGVPSQETFEFDLDGQREAISKRDAEEMVRWGIKTLARAREQAAQAPREEPRQTVGHAASYPATQPQAHDPQLMSRLDRLEASLRERDIRDQSDALYHEIDQSLNESEVLKELSGEERRQATGLVAAVIAGDRNVSVKSAAQKVESILGKLSQRSKNQYIQDKITQSATRPPARGAPASTPTPKLVGKDLFNGKVESAALQRALRAQNS